MGVFDSVYVPCVKCKNEIEFQTKSGPCAMLRFGLDVAPYDVMLDINRHGAHSCRTCDTKVVVGIRDGRFVPMTEDEALKSTAQVTNRDSLAAMVRAAIMGGIHQATERFGMWEDFRPTAETLAQDAVTKVYKVPKEEIDRKYEERERELAEFHRKNMERLRASGMLPKDPTEPS